jgi:hypothetical protein
MILKESESAANGRGCRATAPAARALPNGLAELFKGLFTKTQADENKITYWQLIWMQSEANGCIYHGDNLPYDIWAWPRNTWFQERLRQHPQSSRNCRSPREKCPVKLAHIQSPFTVS